MKSTSTIYLKFLYLIVASTAIVLIGHPVTFAVFGVTQAVLFLKWPVPLRRLKKTITRLLLLFLTVFLSNIFGKAGTNFWSVHVPVINVEWLISVDGLYRSVELSARVLLIVLASVWVQQSSKKKDFMAALAVFKLPESVALTIDATLELVTGGGAGTGQGRRHKQKLAKENPDEGGAVVTWQEFRQRKASLLTDLLAGASDKTTVYLRNAYPHLSNERLNQIVLVAGGCVGVMSLRLLQILPGLPIAPGHKNLVIAPVMLFVAKRYGRFGGGTALGVSIGLCSFMLGFGKFGIFEALHFLVPGLLADLLAPMLSNRRNIIQFLQLVVFGAILGAGRFSANAALIVLAGTPIAALVAYAPMFLSQVGFGAAGAFFGTVLFASDLKPANHGDNNGNENNNLNADSIHREGNGNGSGGGGGTGGGQGKGRKG